MSDNDAVSQHRKIIVHVDDDLEDLIPGFLQNRENDAKAILKALETGDYETVRVLGHNMKGSGGGYGFDAIADIGLALEQAAKEGNPEEIKKQVNELSTYLARVEIVYE